jgi:hypothetical protein
VAAGRNLLVFIGAATTAGMAGTTTTAGMVGVATTAGIASAATVGIGTVATGRKILFVDTQAGAASSVLDSDVESLTSIGAGFVGGVGTEEVEVVS